MHFTTGSTQTCVVCGKSFWGIEKETCGPCEAVVRAWTAKGFLDLCHYLEKVSAFEAFCLNQESSDDPAPAADE